MPPVIALVLAFLCFTVKGKDDWLPILLIGGAVVLAGMFYH